MAIIPLKQTATIRKLLPQPTDEWLDDWDVENYGEPITLRCRAVESLQHVDVKSTAGGMSKGTDEYVRATLVLYFDKIPDIDYDTLVSFTNELGVTITRKPTLIQPVRMISGKVALTEVRL